MVIDFETTGLSPKYGDEICEVAAVKMLNHKIAATFTTLVNPCRPISPGASAVNNITDEMVRNAPKFEHIYQEFINFIADGVIVGHNLSFDMGFLKEKLKRMGKPDPENCTLDTLRLARKMYPHFPSFKLTHLRGQFCIEAKEEHRALSDVIATAELLKIMLKDYEKKGLKEI